MKITNNLILFIIEVIKNMKEKKIIHENLVEVDILYDFWNIQKQCRESYYYLYSLKEKLMNLTVNQDTYNKDEHNELFDSSKKLIEEFELLDKKIFSLDDNITQEVAASIEDINNNNQQEMNLNITIDFIKQAILHKERIDCLQIRILKYLTKNQNNINEGVSKKEKKLEVFYLNEMYKSLFTSSFVRSVDEDKIVTYKLFTKSKEVEKDLKKEKIEMPIYLKAVDYSYVLSILRNKAKRSIELTGQLLELSVRVSEENKIISYTRTATYVAIVSTVISVISILISILIAYKLIGTS